MPANAEALGILLVLLPGFACAYIVQSLAVRRKQSELDKVIEALLFSLILYVATLPFFDNSLPIGWQLVDPRRADIYRVRIIWAQLAVLAGSALIFAILYAANINHDWLMILFRRMRITERTARSTIWNDVFQETGGFVQVGISDGRNVMGWLRYYSDEASEPSLFLEQAAWIVRAEGGAEVEIPIEGPGILLTKETPIEYVIFLGWRKQEPEADGSSQMLDD